MIIDHMIDKAYFDFTGPFHFVSARGFKYIFLLYYYDSNAILKAPLKSRSGLEIMTAWKTLHDKLKIEGIKPNIYIYIYIYIMDHKADVV